MNEQNLDTLSLEAIGLLKSLIAVPSFSREESGTAHLIAGFFEKKQVPVNRHLNNIWVRNKNWDPSLPVLLLNSHHDTVRPNQAYTLDPFLPAEKDGKLYGLGSNDAGGALVSLIASFLYFFDNPKLKYNLLLAASAEEEISGPDGIESLLPVLGEIDCAIVGEPTGMQMAVAERGLMVLDCLSTGRAGHAARDEGDNAIYKAMMDIEWFYTYRFPNVSDLLGPVSMKITVIGTGNKAHNVIPADCSFVVDLRLNELYTFDEILEVIRANVQSDVKPRSTRLRPSVISREHPLVRAGLELNRACYGSPTTSDKALMPFPALKMGPGDSARSHTADEYIYTEEIKDGIKIYVQLLEKVLR